MSTLNELSKLRDENQLLRYRIAEFEAKQQMSAKQNIALQAIEDARSQMMLRRQREAEALAAIAVSAELAEGAVRELAVKLTEAASKAIEVERVGVWLFEEGTARLVNIDNYFASTNEHSSGAVLLEHEYKNEFDVLKTAKYVDADDPLTDPRTAGYVDGYLKPNRISAMLDSVIRAGGHALGLLCFEHVAKSHHWEDDEITFACQLADQVALALSSHERKRAEEEIRAQSAFRQSVIEFAADGICVCHEISDYPFVAFTVWNNRMIALTGYTMEEINQVGWYQAAYPDPDLQRRAIERMSRMRVGDNLVAEEWQITRKDGEKRTISISTSVISGHGSPAYVLAVMHDLTDQKRAEEAKRKLEAQFQHTQKLESLGVLAGGIAHDFNNLLMGVLGHADLALLELSAASPLRGHLSNIKKTAIRLAEITKQMLAYSGRGRFVTMPINLSSLVNEMYELLHVSLPKKVALKLDLRSDLPVIEVDSNQIRQVVMNLITNAADAIGEEGGSVTIRTGVVAADRDYLAQFQFDSDKSEGMYVYLEVSDTGCGMTKDVQEKIFDPFFTTKFAGRGLGLAALQGIVRGHKGSIKVYSEAGKGSTFKVLFPCSTQMIQVVDQKSESEIDPEPCTGGTMLVIDDEETVRDVAMLMLEKAGYLVLLADGGEKGLSILREHVQDIKAVLLDLNMPKMSGIEAFEQARCIAPDIPVILCSGYNEQEATRQFTGQGLADFLQKPYDYKTLARKVGEVIARKSNQATISLGHPCPREPRREP